METMNIGFEIRPALYNAEVSEEVEDVGKDRLQKKRGGKEKISETFWREISSTNWDCDDLWWLWWDGGDGWRWCRTWRQWWRCRQDPLSLPGALQVWWAVLGWFRPRAKNLVKEIRQHYLSIIIIINSNVDILPICNIIGSCPFYVVGGDCLGGESQFSILSHDEMSWKMSSTFSQNPNLEPIGNIKQQKANPTLPMGTTAAGSWYCSAGIGNPQWLPGSGKEIGKLYNYRFFIYLLWIISSVRSSNSHPDLLLIHPPPPTFSDHTGPQYWTFTFWATTAI